MLCSPPMIVNGEQLRLQCPSNQDQKLSFRRSKASGPGSVKSTEVRDLGNMLNNYVVSHGSQEESVL